MKKTAQILQQRSDEISAPRVKICNSKYKNESGILLSCDNYRARIFLENSNYKTVTVPSSIVKITEFNNKSLSLEHLTPAIISVVVSAKYDSKDITTIVECDNLKKLDMFLNKKYIKNQRINYIHGTILNEGGFLIGGMMILSYIFRQIAVMIGDKVWGIISKIKDDHLNAMIQGVIQTFPGATAYLDGLSKYGKVVVYIGSIYLVFKLFPIILRKLIEGKFNIEDFKEEIKRAFEAQQRVLNWLDNLKQPITEEEARGYGKNPEKSFAVNISNSDFLQNLNKIGESLYANEKTKDIFYFDKNTSTLVVTNRYHSKKHIDIDKAKQILSSNPNSVIETSIFALAPSGAIPKIANKIRDFFGKKGSNSQPTDRPEEGSPISSPSATPQRRLPPPLPPRSPSAMPPPRPTRESR